MRCRVGDLAMPGRNEILRVGWHQCAVLTNRPALQVSALLKLPQSVGFIGGRPRSAHYFVATRGRLVYFLDPHQTQPYVPLGNGNEGPRQHGSWHCDIQRRMSLADIDASLTFGFYCR